MEQTTMVKQNPRALTNNFGKEILMVVITQQNLP
jgi:hypothetical protein